VSQNGQTCSTLCKKKKKKSSHRLLSSRRSLVAGQGKPSAFIQYRNKKISSQNDAAWIDWPAASVSSLDYFLLPSSFDLFLPEKTSINSQCSFYHWLRKRLSGDDDGPERTSGFSYFLHCTLSHSVKPVYLDHNKLQSQPTNIPGNKMNYKSWTSSILCSHKDSLSLSLVSLVRQHKDARNVVWEEFEVQITEGTHDITRLCSSPILLCLLHLARSCEPA
jgi:hypothetical protein